MDEVSASNEVSVHSGGPDVAADPAGSPNASAKSACNDTHMGEPLEEDGREAGDGSGGTDSFESADGAEEEMKGRDAGGSYTEGADESVAEEGLGTTGIAANEVKNIILQVLSPYFDDGGVGAPAGGAHTSPTTTTAHEAGEAGGEGAAGGAGTFAPTLEDEDTAQRYDHTKASSWIQLICDGLMERLVGMGKPYKFVTHIMVMRKNGAGMHVCSSCMYSQTDGWLSHAHDLSPHIYAVVTVYWLAI